MVIVLTNKACKKEEWLLYLDEQKEFDLMDHIHGVQCSAYSH